MSRGDAEWQRIVRGASDRGRTAEGIGLRWDAPGWTVEESRYLNRLSAWDRRQLEQDIIDALDTAPELVDKPGGPYRVELTHDEILEAREVLIAADDSGSKSLTAKRLHVSESTLDRRWRELHGGASPGWPCDCSAS